MMTIAEFGLRHRLCSSFQPIQHDNLDRGKDKWQEEEEEDDKMCIAPNNHQAIGLLQ